MSVTKWLKPAALCAMVAVLVHLSPAQAQGNKPHVNRLGVIFSSPYAPDPALLCEWPRKWVTEGLSSGYARDALLVSDELVYVGARKLHAIHRLTGEVVWEFSYPVPDQYKGSRGSGITMLREDGDVLYYGTSAAKLFAINKHTGAKLWEFDLSQGVSLNLVFDARRLYVGSVGYIYALNKTNGTLVWQRKTDEGEGLRAPLVQGGRVFTHTYNTLYALDAATGKELWHYIPAEEPRGMEGYLTKPPRFSHAADLQLYQNMVLVTEAGGKLTSIDMRTGEKRWQVTVSPIFPENPIMVTPEGKLIMDSGNGVGLLNPEAQDYDWWFSALGIIVKNYHSPALYKDLLLIGTNRKYVYAIDRFTGYEVFRFPYAAPLTEVSAIAARDDEVYMLDYQGRLYAYALKCPQLAGREAWR